MNHVNMIARAYAGIVADNIPLYAIQVKL